jgi:hypothetical protein
MLKKYNIIILRAFHIVVKKKKKSIPYWLKHLQTEKPPFKNDYGYFSYNSKFDAYFSPKLYRKNFFDKNILIIWTTTIESTFIQLHQA